MEDNRGRALRNMYKGHMDKAKGGRFKGGRQGWMGWRGVLRWKWRQLYLNNNKNKCMWEP